MSNEDADKIVGRITRKLLWTLLPTILLTIGSMFIYDHFTLANKADREMVQKNMYNLTLIIEAKTRALESIAKSNSKDVMYLKEADVELKDAIENLDEAQDEMDKYIREKFRVRGISELPDF